jgi:predicted ATPase
MASRRNRTINMSAPYLRQVWLDPARIADRASYPFCLPFLRDEFELSFDRPITIIAGENGTGKSTLLEGIAVLAGYDEAGGGKGYRPVDHSDAVEVMGGDLSEALRASWLPKITNGWFFRAESFFSVARYLDERRTIATLGRRISSRIRTAKVFCGFSRSVASDKASSSLTNRSRRCLPRARWNSSS